MKKSEIKEELLSILPYGTKLDDQVIDDMPQFLREYLNALKHRALEMYPYRKDKIQTAYDHIITDMSDSELTKFKD